MKNTNKNLFKVTVHFTHYHDSYTILAKDDLQARDAAVKRSEQLEGGSSEDVGVQPEKVIFCEIELIADDIRTI
jgi:hypothetical protein